MHQPGSSYCGPIMLLLILLEEVRCIPYNIFGELYEVKVWEGMV